MPGLYADHCVQIVGIYQSIMDSMDLLISAEFTILN